MQRSKSVVLVCERAHAETQTESWAGFVRLYPSFSSVSAARVFVLNDLYVSEDRRRAGLARKLLQAAQKFASESGAVRMALSAAVDNHRAQALHASLGWQRDSAYFHYGLSLAYAARA